MTLLKDSMIRAKINSTNTNRVNLELKQLKEASIKNHLSDQTLLIIRNY